MSLFINKRTIYTLADGPSSYYQGEKLYKNGHVGNVNFINLPSGTLYTSTVSDNGKEHKVEILFNHSNNILRVSCSCYHIWSSYCHHRIAALLYLSENSSEQFNEIEMQNSILESIENKIIKNIEENQLSNDELIKLTPTLYTENDYFFMSFTIGNNRPYVLKDLSVFSSNIQHEKTYAYGKSLEFKHSLSVFDKNSQKLVNLILDETKISSKYSRPITAFTKNYGKLDSRFLILSPYGLAHLFEKYNKSLDFIDNGYEYKNIKLKKGLPNLNIEIEETENSFSLIVKSLPEFFIKSGSFHLAFKENCLYLIEDDNIEIIKSITETASKSPNNTIKFSNEVKRRFFYSTLPELINIGIISEDDIKKELPDLSYQVYADYIDDTINLTAYINIDGERENILENKKNNYSEKNFFAKILRGFNFIPDNNYFTISGDDKIYNFIVGGINELRKYADVFVSDNFNRVSPARRTSAPNIDVRLNGNLLELNFDSVGYPLEELFKMLTKYKESKKYIKLKNGSFIDIDNEFYKNTFELLDSLKIKNKDIKDNKIKIKKYDALFLNDILDNNEYFSNTVDDNVKTFVNDIKNFANPIFSPPDGLKNILRDYQVLGFKWLATLSNYKMGGILADEMGLGKTLQAISLMAYAKENSDHIQSLVVCPTSLIYNWQKEISRFCSNLQTEILAGNVEKRRELINSSKADILITTYDTVKRDIDIYNDKEFSFVFADEAQNIKNPTTQNAKALKSIKSQVCFALTGTPIENSLTELWSIFDFILPGYLGNITTFNKEFAKKITKSNDEKTKTLLKRKISPFILKRTKKEVLKELPEKIETIFYSDMTEEQRKLYTAYLMEAKDELSDIKDQGGYSKNRIKILSMITRLRQICCDPAIFLENYKGGSGKLDSCIEQIETYIESNHRILLFSQFTSMLKIISKELDERNIKYFYLDGSTKSKDRLDMSENFNNGKNDIFLISLKAGGTGLNLTGADFVLHYDPWWNPSIMAQATDRAHRIGQEKVVNVISMVSKDTIEEKIIELQNRKKELISSVLENDVAFFDKMTDEELEYLLL